MNVGIGTEIEQFPFWEYSFLMFGIVSLQFTYVHVHCAGHFTHLVWKSSTRLGVGRARGRNFDYVVAVYSPPGTDSPKQPYFFDNNVRQKM